MLKLPTAASSVFCRLEVQDSVFQDSELLFSENFEKVLIDKLIN